MEIKPVELVRKPKPFDRDEAARAYDRSHTGQTPRPVFIREEGRLRDFQQIQATFNESGKFSQRECGGCRFSIPA